MKRVRFILYALILFAFVGMTPAFAQQNSKVVVSVIKGPSGLSSAWMMSELLKTSPDEFGFTTVASADMVVAKLLNGEIAAGVLPVNVAAKLFNAGAPIRALAVVGNGMVKFLTTDPNLTSLADVKGKTIYIAGQKATPDYLFQYLCAAYGLNAGSEYTPVYNLTYPEIAAALAAGKIQYAVLPEPFASQAMLKNPNVRAAVDLKHEWQFRTGQEDYPMSLFVCRKELIESNPQKARILLDSYRASLQKAKEDPIATGKLAESLDLGISAQVAASAIPLSNFVFIEAPAARPSIETLLAVFMKFEPASVGGKLPDSAFYASLR